MIFSFSSWIQTELNFHSNKSCKQTQTFFHDKNAKNIIHLKAIWAISVIQIFSFSSWIQIYTSYLYFQGNKLCKQTQPIFTSISRANRLRPIFTAISSAYRLRPIFTAVGMRHRIKLCNGVILSQALSSSQKAKKQCNPSPFWGYHVCYMVGVRKGIHP